MPQTEYSYCETIAANLLHIRPLTAKGRRYGGGADTLGLCGAKVLWDVGVPINERTLVQTGIYGTCQKCRKVYEEAARDRRIVEHLIEKLLGKAWRLIEPDDNPSRQLESWDFAGTVWERAREMGLLVELHNQGRQNDWWAKIDRITSYDPAGPRALCEAIYRATGGEDLL